MSGKSGRASRNALKRLGEQDTFESDTRSAQLREIAVVQDPEVINTLEAIFKGTTVMVDPHKANVLVQVRQEIHAEWKKASQSFLAIGRSLLMLEKTLTVEEFRRLTKGTERIFPFTETVAFQLRRVADAVTRGVMDETEMPGSYSVAYQIALMDPPTIEMARLRNLVRPDVTRTEVIKFRREINAEPKAMMHRIDLENVRRKKTRLAKLRGQLIQQLDEIDAQIAELSAVRT